MRAPTILSANQSTNPIVFVFNSDAATFHFVRFFVVVNSIVAAYLVLSIPLSIVHIIRSRAKYSRLVLVFFDAVRPRF